MSTGTGITSGSSNNNDEALTSASKCPLCMTDTYFKDDIKIYYGDPCGHCFCSECSHKINKKNLNLSKTISNTCPVCLNYVKYVLDYEYGETEFLKHENTHRKYVYSIMNESRNDFKDTPCYNDYLEKREDYVYQLIYGDESEKRSIQELLNQHSKDNQMSILERKTREETKLKNSIIEIVNQEGIFYEQLNQLSQNTYIDHLQIVHPLQNEYPEFFNSYQNKRNNQNEKENGSNNFGILILGKNIPNPIDTNITSRDQIHRRNNIPIELRQRAGGFTENIVWNLCKDELLYGFYSQAFSHN
ncbi:ring domain protein [Cryptosporidium ryanae]|uniref:ring domain protein n=1 Tax=Cryptosporidium ryanae TaxID=515981 RepID=UPI00351AA7CC|nr:ring domain protein [Cryptosporidium ryanae]